MRPAAGRRGEDGRNRKRDLLIAHVPSLFPNHQRHCSKCHCVHVCVCVHTRTTCTQSHINYNQIGYWSHTALSIDPAYTVWQRVMKHFLLSLEAQREYQIFHREGNHFSPAHVVQMTIFTANKVCSNLWLRDLLLNFDSFLLKSTSGTLKMVCLQRDISAGLCLLELLQSIFWPSHAV